MWPVFEDLSDVKLHQRSGDAQLLAVWGQV